MASGTEDAVTPPPARLLDRVRDRIRVRHFLTNLAVVHNVSAPTQNQAKSALLFLYKEVLGIELPWLERIDRARAPTRLPVVLTREEAASVLGQLHGVHGLIGRLLYGTGMRIMEAMRLRVQDADFGRREILIRDGKVTRTASLFCRARSSRRYANSSTRPARCIDGISWPDLATSGCRTPSSITSK